MTPQQVVDAILSAGGNPGRAVLGRIAQGNLRAAHEAASGTTVQNALQRIIQYDLQGRGRIDPGPVSNPKRGINLAFAGQPLDATQSNLSAQSSVPAPYDTSPVGGSQPGGQVPSTFSPAPTGGTPPISGGNGGNSTGGGGWLGDLQDTIGDIRDVIDTIGDFFGGGNGGSPQPIAPQNGGGGQVPAIIAQIPDGIVNILENAKDVADLVANPSVTNFLKALDPTTANQILQYFGISGSVSGLVSGGGDQMIPTGDGMQGAMMMEMMTDSITSKSGKAIFQAMQGGTLQNRGVWFQAQPTETPRGTMHVSPPGYVTVEVSGTKYSVLRPIAKSLFGYESDSSSSTLQKADKAVRKLGKYERQIKKILPKLGYTKSPDRLKSGPRR